MPKRIPCAGAILVDQEGRLLLVRRGRPPAVGSWTVPGGRCEAGEAPVDACIREVAEETGLDVRVVRHAGRVERPSPTGDIWVIDDYVCEVVGGTLEAGDDASDARWFPVTALPGVTLVPKLAETLVEWGVLPPVR